MLRKTRKLLKALSLVIRRPYLLNHVINSNEEWGKYIGKKYSLSLGLPVVELETLFPGFHVNIPVFTFLDGGSLPTDIALLMKFASSFDPCSYFEIGTWRGESVANVAGIAHDCFTLNLSDEEMRKSGASEEYIRQTGLLSKPKKNITHLRGNSKNFDFQSLNRKFDLIFIDGDHHYEAVKNDTEKVFSHLVHENSVVVWHDYATSPETIRNEVLAGILDGLPKKHHINLYHAGNTLSAFYYNKQLPANPLKNPTRPEHVFSLTIERRSF
jgi:predicted O-methyltransferase YrrM